MIRIIDSANTLLLVESIAELDTVIMESSLLCHVDVMIAIGNNLCSDTVESGRNRELYIIQGLHS